ncbi:serine/threonine protein kinase [Amycolatopsis australiensis]|uniref:Restriction endonuclease n=1 Tax=Amycolatopsis australiensis TaxID=546364 RepID=A0A1K1T5Y9_9PSEU|nr:serine/threonine protein kinase [Amycolatopsis australiensis]SFW92041.1 hypothetical protein SAMN04489730_8346 [Amycolatopsis australiensis]
MSQDAVAVAPSLAGVTAGEARINFAAHQARANAQGARQDFEEMIGQLVRAVRPGVVKMVAANPGDWGIDVFIGDLGGSVTVWQSKYFMPEVSKSHQAQIRESFDSVVANAAKEGFTLTQWILCVPSSMDGPTTKWWSTWKRKKERDFGLVIDLWDETELRSLLISPDAETVRRHYYEPAQATRPETSVVGLADEDAERLETALFVRQLREAGHVEVTSSKQQFFNAELLAREIVDKGVPAEVAALSSADATIHGVWEDHFNEACQTDESPRLAGLHKSVMSEIRAQHATLSSGLPCGPVHTCGLMHRVVDNRRAGWVRHWRQIADEHVRSDGEQSQDTTTAIALNGPQPASPS